MLVSHLIKFRDELIKKIQLINESSDQILTPYNLLNSVINDYTEINPISFSQEKITQTLTKYKQLHDQYKEISKPLESIIDDINRVIDQLALDKLLADSSPNALNYYRKKVFSESEEVHVALRAKLHAHSNFAFPGMCFPCNNRSIIDNLVASDPLYLCDADMLNIKNLTSHFNEIYNQRLRKYVIYNNNLSKLPYNQFGFIISWMFFNYVEFELMKSYLSEMIKLLRPGGTILCTYNNGDIEDSCKLSEGRVMSFIPKRWLVAYCHQIGYEIVNTIDFPNDDPEVKFISWIELRKPGQLTTIKRMQALGGIKLK